jgi:hypothetical protein
MIRSPEQTFLGLRCGIMTGLEWPKKEFGVADGHFGISSSGDDGYAYPSVYICRNAGKAAKSIAVSEGAVCSPASSAVAGPAAAAQPGNGSVARPVRRDEEFDRIPITAEDAFLQLFLQYFCKCYTIKIPSF